MPDIRFTAAADFELRFWMQILGDHARFIRDSLAPSEEKEISRAKKWVGTFDDILARVRQAPGAGTTSAAPASVIDLAQEAHQRATEFREFKLHLLRRHLLRELHSTLPPTFYNHMVNELEECMRVMASLSHEKVPGPGHAVHQHLLWLPDASGHAASLASLVDLAERQKHHQLDTYALEFDELYLKAIELAGYLRAHIDDFPALRQFNADVELEIALFRAFLLELEEMELTNRLLGSIAPLMTDHMAREECYYLRKLSETSSAINTDAGNGTYLNGTHQNGTYHGGVATTDANCDPTAPRVEDPRVQ